MNPKKLKFKLILNPKAGNSQASGIAHQVEEILEAKKVLYSLDTTYRAQGATLLAKRAVKLGFNVIVAMGGDGTVNEVVNGMLHSGSTLGIIPCGLRNTLAKALDIPLDPKEACEALLSGTVRRIDVGKINDRYFVDGVGIGLDAQMINSKKSWIKMLRYKPQPISLKFENGKLIDTKALLMAVANGKYFGGSFRLTPKAKLDDRLLDVCVVSSPGKLKLLSKWGKISKDEPITLPYSTKLKTEEVWIDSPYPIPLHVDGELAEDDRPYHITLSRRRLKVAIPGLSGI